MAEAARHQQEDTVPISHDANTKIKLDLPETPYQELHAEPCTGEMRMVLSQPMTTI